MSRLAKKFAFHNLVRACDACGFGFVARVDGRRTRETIEEGLEVLRNLDHRGASGSDPETGVHEHEPVSNPPTDEDHVDLWTKS